MAIKVETHIHGIQQSKNYVILILPHFDTVVDCNAFNEATDITIAIWKNEDIGSDLKPFVYKREHDILQSVISYYMSKTDDEIESMESLYYTGIHDLTEIMNLGCKVEDLVPGLFFRSDLYKFLNDKFENNKEFLSSYVENIDTCSLDKMPDNEIISKVGKDIQKLSKVMEAKK